MPGENLKQYIEKHSFCSEYLFKDWDAFLDVLYSEGERVSAILWWDHCRRKMQHMSAGGGGYLDPDDPEYMYAETQFYEDGFETKTLEEIKDYISNMRKSGLIMADKYICFDLVPSFYLET